MPTINLTNNTTLDLSASTSDNNATLNRYLKSVLRFKTPPNFDAVAGQLVKDIDASGFPVTATAMVSSNFAVEQATLSVQPSAAAILDVLTEGRKSDFVEPLMLPD